MSAIVGFEPCIDGPLDGDAIAVGPVPDPIVRCCVASHPSVVGPNQIFVVVAGHPDVFDKTCPTHYYRRCDQGHYHYAEVLPPRG